MAASQPALFNVQEFTDAGVTLVGGRLYTYEYGTTTFKAAYTDPEGAVPQTYTPDGLGGQFIALNMRGELPAPLYLGAGSYDISLKRADGSTVWTRKTEGVDAATNALTATLTAPSGSGLVGYSSAGGEPDTVGGVLSRTVYVFDFMTPQERIAAINGSSYDHAPAIQRALDAVSPISVDGLTSRAGTVIFDPRYPLLIKTTINATNSRAGGTRSRDGLRLYGINLIGETGSNTAIIETTGSQWLEIDGVIESKGGSASSTVGLMQALSIALPQTQNQRISLRIFMHDDATANNGIGTVGAWICGAEENTYDSLYVQANVPVFMTGYAQSPNLSAKMPASYQDPLVASHSCGVNTFSGETFLASLGRHRPSLITEDVNSVRFENVYMVNIGDSGGGNIDAWWQYGGFQGGVVQGTIEQHSSIRVQGICAATKINITFGAIHDPTAPMIELVRGAQGQIVSSDVHIHNAESANRQLFQCTPVSPSEQVSCFLQNSTVKLNSDRQYCVLPENLSWNPNTGNVSIYAQCGGAPYHYRIDGNRNIKINILPTTCYVYGSVAGAPIVTFIGPSVFGEATGANALTAKIRIEGIASIVNPGTNANSMRYVDATILLLINSAGSMGVAGAVVTAQSQLDQNAAGNSITALSFSASVTDVTAQIVLSPTVTGINHESVTFTGTAEMSWSGNESRTPRLEV